MREVKEQEESLRSGGTSDRVRHCRCATCYPVAGVPVIALCSTRYVSRYPGGGPGLKQAPPQEACAVCLDLIKQREAWPCKGAH